MPRKLVVLVAVVLTGLAAFGLYTGMSGSLSRQRDDSRTTATAPASQALGTATEARPLDTTAAIETPKSDADKDDAEPDQATPKPAAPKAVASLETPKAPTSTNDAIADILAAPQEPASPTPPRPPTRQRTRSIERHAPAATGFAVRADRGPPAGGVLTRPPRPSPGLPDRETLARFIREAGETDTDRIARHFGLKGAERRELRHMLRDMKSAGEVGQRGRKGVAEPGALPPVGVAEVVERDADGDLYVRLVKAEEDAPTVRLAPTKGEAVAGAPGLGDRVLVHFERRDGGFEARLIKRLGQAVHRVLGVVRKSRGQVRIEPVDRKSRDVVSVAGPEGAT